MMIANVTGNGRKVGITGVGAYVPDKILTNDDLSTMVETSDEWIIERTGIKERRIAAPEQAASDLALPRAGRRSSGPAPSRRRRPGDGRDSRRPTCSFRRRRPLVADALGSHDAAAYDLSAGCTGFMYGLAQAYASVAGGLAERRS